MNEYLDSLDPEFSRSSFYRMLALGCLDAIITLPITITNMIASIAEIGQLLDFYPGWSFLHSDWEPLLYPKSTWSMGKWLMFTVHWDEWINLFFALVFFCIFGLTPEARKGYRAFFLFLRGPFSARQEDSTEEGLPDVVFKTGRGTCTTVTSNVSSRYASSASLPAGNSHPSYSVVLKQMSWYEPPFKFNLLSSRTETLLRGIC